VLKELTVFAMVYNLVRMVMCHSAILQHIAVERISFLDALRCSAGLNPNGIKLASERCWTNAGAALSVNHKGKLLGSPAS